MQRLFNRDSKTSAQSGHKGKAASSVDKPDLSKLNAKLEIPPEKQLPGIETPINNALAKYDALLGKIQMARSQLNEKGIDQEDHDKVEKFLNSLQTYCEGAKKDLNGERHLTYTRFIYPQALEQMPQKNGKAAVQQTPEEKAAIQEQALDYVTRIGITGVDKTFQKPATKRAEELLKEKYGNTTPDPDSPLYKLVKELHPPGANEHLAKAMGIDKNFGGMDQDTFAYKTKFDPADSEPRSESGSSALKDDSKTRPR